MDRVTHLVNTVVCCMASPFFQGFDENRLSLNIKIHDFQQYQDSNALVFCFEDTDIKLCHCLLTRLEFERQTSSAACFDQQVRKNRNENKIKLCFRWISNVSKKRSEFELTLYLRWYTFKLYLEEITLFL